MQTQSQSAVPSKEVAKVDPRIAGMDKLLKHPSLVTMLAKSLGKSMSPDKYASIAYRVFRTAGDAMLKADPATFIAAIVEAAQLGLNPDPNLHECYLIPRFNGKQNRTEVHFMLGYRGMTKLMCGGSIDSIYAEVVYEGDDFSSLGGSNPQITHRQSDPGERAVVAAYAVAFPSNGGRPINRVVWRSELDSSAEKSGNPKNKEMSNFWRDHYAAMARKTAIRRLFSLVPIGAAAADAVGRDDERAAGNSVSQIIDIEIPGLDLSGVSGASDLDALAEGGAA